MHQINNNNFGIYIDEVCSLPCEERYKHKINFTVYLGSPKIIKLIPERERVICRGTNHNLMLMRKNSENGHRSFRSFSSLSVLKLESTLSALKCYQK